MTKFLVKDLMYMTDMPAIKKLSISLSFILKLSRVKIKFMKCTFSSHRLYFHIDIVFQFDHTHIKKKHCHFFFVLL